MGFRFAWLFLLTCTFAACQSTLADASLEELLQMKVTSVSKKEQRLSKAAAAIFVINQEDIRRSGATNIPDLLRMAPGVDVAQINANSWAITIRGFNSRYSNKVLVLVDGRSVYTPSFSGVFWEHIELPLEDIERIEVIRGPGATVWGANAVNGVINIITKSSKATKGGLLAAESGSEVYAAGVLRYGAAAGRNGSFRVFGRYLNMSDSLLPDGAEGADGWTRMHAGFRSDWDLSNRDSLTVQGDLFSNRQGQTLRTSYYATQFDRTFAQEFDATGGNLLARWSHSLEGGSEMALQSYYDTYRRTDLATPEKVNVFDLDFQHHAALGARHDVVWGLGYRASQSAIPPGYSISLSPPSRTDSLYSSFLQDEIRVADTLWLTLGCKFEHNPYTGFEYEPSARLAWAASPRTTLWAAASRAIRQPARMDTSIGVDLATYPLDAYTTQTLRLFGNPHLKTEEVRDFQLGYRTQLSHSISLDLATFLSSYRRLTTIEPGTPVAIPEPTFVRIKIPMVYDNKASALDYGGELSVNWNAAAHWRIGSTYSFLKVKPRLDPSSRDITTLATMIDVPSHMFQVRSLWNITRRWEFDQSLSWTAKLPGSNISAYARLDGRLARRLGESVEISLVGQNLLRPGVAQFPDIVRVIGTLAQRSVFGKITWVF